VTLLSLVKDAADIIGLPRPSAVVGSGDQTVRRLLALAQIEGNELSRRHEWQALVKEKVHVTLAAEDQGAVTTLISDFRSLIGGTMWNRSTQDYVGGPVSPQDWQEYKAQTSAGPYFDFRIRGGKLLVFPAPAAGQNLALEYISTNWCQSSGGTGQTAWALDTDTGILSEYLMTLGLVWRFQQVAGLEYGEAMRSYERAVVDAVAKDGSRPVLSLAEGSFDIGYRPTARAPDGSWPL